MNPENFIGKIIGNYIIKEVLGEGSFSTVYLAEKIQSDTDFSKINELSKEKNTNKAQKRVIPKHFVACKVISKAKVEKKKLLNRLNQEIRIHQIMHHPNVIQLIDVQKDSSYYYIFLEFALCGELFEIVLKKRKLTEREAAFFFKQILIGLKYIHSLNVAHRDLKPENILIDEFGRVKIADFGLSILLNDKNNGFTKTPCGSLCYTSPECLSGNLYDGKKSDIWSCGVILYAITTGFLPWTKRTETLIIQQIRKGEYKIPFFLSDSCANLIRRLMTVDSNKRITIDEALEHPFLKDVFVPSGNFESTFVSLRKIDRFIENNEELDNYSNAISNLSQSESDNSSGSNYFVVRKRINEPGDQIKTNQQKENRQLTTKNNMTKKVNSTNNKEESQQRKMKIPNSSIKMDKNSSFVSKIAIKNNNNLLY